jgi:hypothetical protein
MDCCGSSGGEESSGIMNPLIKGKPKEPQDKRKQIFEEPPHFTMDNFFSGDKVNFLGQEGWKATMTC